MCGGWLGAAVAFVSVIAAAVVAGAAGVWLFDRTVGRR